MKMKIELHETEALEVLAALRDCAVENGWEEEELDDCGVIEEYASVIDAAMRAMGIDFCINVEPDSDSEYEEEEEDWDEDDDEDDWEDEDEDEDEELSSDEEVMNLIMLVLYGQ